MTQPLHEDPFLCFYRHSTRAEAALHAFFIQYHVGTEAMRKDATKSSVEFSRANFALNALELVECPNGYRDTL